jgi:dTMP kinase
MNYGVKKKRISRGVLLVIEGIDGSGKTTQAERLAVSLMSDGYDVLSLREPTDGRWGKAIRQAAHANERRKDPEREYELFLLDRRQNVEENIAPALSAGRVVVLDRYYFSTMAYQGARGLEPGRIRVENEAFAPVPDRVFYISITVAEGLRRISQDRGGFTSFEREEYLNRVKELFDEHLTCLPFVVVVDGMRHQDAVFDEIGRAAARFLDTLSSRG